MRFTFDINGDYHEQLTAYIEEILRIANDDDAEATLGGVEDRCKLIESLFESYITTVHKRPPYEHIGRLVRVIDYEYYTLNHRNKTQLHEYSYLTETQEKLRQKSEASWLLADTFDSDGINYAVPTRVTMRKRRELLGLDSQTRSLYDKRSDTNEIHTL